MAVTEGDHVAFASGRYRPGTLWGEALLAHELAHVRQQRGLTGGGVGDSELEGEANRAGFIAALRLFDPARAAGLASPSFSPVGVRLQRCAHPDFSDINQLPTREEYERRGELMPRVFSTLAVPSTGVIDLTGGRSGSSARAETPALAAHPNPIRDDFGNSAQPMTPPQMVLRLDAMEVVVGQIAKLIENNPGLPRGGTQPSVARWRLAGESMRHEGKVPHLTLVGFQIDPLDATPDEPSQLTREVLRSEHALNRTYQSLVELASDRQQEEATGRPMAEASKGRSGSGYDIDHALWEIDSVGISYLEAVESVLTPRMIKRFNYADALHGQLGPNLLRRKLDYYQSLKASVKGIEDSTSQINDWAARLQTDLTSLQQDAPRVREARETRSPDLEALEASFREKAELLATSIEALGEWDRAVQAYEFLAGNSALWGFAGAHSIAARLAQMKDAAFDGDTPYLQLLIRDHRADPHVEEYYKSLPSIVRWSQFIIMLGVMLIAAVVSAGVGIAFAAAAGATATALGAAAAGKVVLTATFVGQVAGEALAFTVVSRALLSAFPGMGPDPKHGFWWDFFWNLGLFGVMRGAALGMRASLATMGRFGRLAASSVTSFGILQTYGLVRFAVEEGRPMTADEFAKMTVDNALMMVGMGIGMKAFEPMLASLEQASALARFRRTYGGHFADIEAARAKLTEDARLRMEALKDRSEIKPEDVADLKSQAAELDAQLRHLVERAMNDRNFDPHVVVREAGEVFGRLERTPLPEVLRQSGLHPSFEIMPAGPEGAWSFPKGRADALVTHLRTAGYEVLADVSTSGGRRVIDAYVPGKGRAQFIERSTTERINVPLTEGEIATARAHAAADVAGGTRGPLVYPLAEAPVQTPQSVRAALRGLAKGLVSEGLHLDSMAGSGEIVTAGLRVEVPATSGKAATTITVPVEVQAVNSLGPGRHGAESGHARLSIEGNGPDSYRLRIEIDARLKTETDVQHNLRHELREGRFILEDLTQGRYTDVSQAQEARVFRPGTETNPSAHDRAAAAELRDLFSELQSKLRSYENARKEAARKTGAAMPPEVRDAGDIAMRRLDAALDAMGFQDPVTRAAKRQALLDMLGEGPNSPVSRYVEAYAERVESTVRREAELTRLAAADRARLETGLGPGLTEHLTSRVPDAAIDPLSQTMRLGEPGNNVRNVLRELLRQHRAGRIGDPSLIEGAQKLEAIVRRYGGEVINPTRANEIQTGLQRNPQGTLVLLEKVEVAIVEAGVTAVPVPLAGVPGSAQVNFRPEPELLGSGLHGIKWTEADARARAAQPPPPGAPPRSLDQSRFGTAADVWYAVQCARHLVPEGTVPGQPYQGVFQLPPGHRNVVYRQGVPGTITPDVIYVRVRPDGTVHAYPADSTVLNMGGLGAIRPAVPW